MDANVVLLRMTPEQAWEMLAQYKPLWDDISISAVMPKPPVLTKKLLVVLDLGDTSSAKVQGDYSIALASGVCKKDLVAGLIGPNYPEHPALQK